MIRNNVQFLFPVCHVIFNFVYPFCVLSSRILVQILEVVGV